MSDTIEVKPRTELGSRSSQRLRAAGHLPAVLYGHGEEPVSLSISIEQMRGVLRHNAKVVDLKGAASGQALLQDIQWNTFGTRPLHVDLMRVSAGEVVTVEVAVELKGEAVGVGEGGMIEQVFRTVEIDAPPASIPELLHVDITNLHLGESITADQIIDMPEGAKLVTPGDATIVHCVKPAGEPEEEEAVAAGADEPEVVGAKKDEEEAEGED